MRARRKAKGNALLRQVRRATIRRAKEAFWATAWTGDPFAALRAEASVLMAQPWYWDECAEAIERFKQTPLYAMLPKDGPAW